MTKQEFLNNFAQKEKPKDTTSAMPFLMESIKEAKRDIVVLNAALGLCTGGKADSIQDGIKLANEIIDSGKAYAKIEEFAKASNE